MKKHLVLGALAVLALAACTKSETLELNRGNEISLSAVSGKNLTKAADGYCNSNKPIDFQVWAATQGKTYFADQKYKNQSGTYVAEGAARYWPDGNVDFFAAKNYKGAGATPATATLDPTAGSTKLTVTGYEVAPAVGDQTDFIYAVTKGATKASTPTNLNFRHALSQIEFRAKNANPNIYVYIGGVKVVNVKNKGTFTMEKETTTGFYNHGNGVTDETDSRGDRGSWSSLDGAATYSVSFSPALELPTDGTVKDLTYDSTVDYNPNSMYLLPQTLDVWRGKTLDGQPSTSGKAYFVVSALIYNVAVPGSFSPATDVVLWGEDLGGGTYGPKDIAVQLPATMKWDDGLRYLYTFNFTEYGMGGSDPDTGDPVLTPITLTVTVDDFVDVADKEVEVK